MTFKFTLIGIFIGLQLGAGFVVWHTEMLNRNKRVFQMFSTELSRKTDGKWVKTSTNHLYFDKF